MKLSYLSEAHGKWLRAWWEALQQKSGPKKKILPELRTLGRADRARLTRANSVEELETERAAVLLVARLLREEWKNKFARNSFKTNPSALLIAAGVLAIVKTDSRDGKSLAWRVGAAAGKGDGSSPMSELRFKRLLQARDLEDFFLLVRRAVQLAAGAVDIAVLADDLLAWVYERELSAGMQRPARSLCFRWAQDYFQPLKDKDAAWAATEETPEGEIA
jgi:CRISPR system Cascade subunit CasB